MQKKWLYRLIMSYIPIFFAVVFCLMLLFFMTMSDLVRKQSVQASGVFASQVMQIVDSTLKNIDTAASKSLLLNEKIAGYFNSSGPQATYAYYEVTEVLLDFMTQVGLVDSIYLYRESDGKVLMQHFSSELAEFGDRAFIAEAMKTPGSLMWSDIRQFALFDTPDTSKRVVSLVKKVPYYSGEQGLIVVNIRTDSLHALIREMSLDGVSSLCMTDGRGSSFEGSDRTCPSGSGEQGNVMELQSDYSSWHLRIGMKQAGLFTYVSAFSYVWFALGFVAIAGGMLAMTYISHRHYRPLEQVLRRIHAFADKRSSLARREAAEDEFAFIDKSLESLIEHTNNYDKLQAEGKLYRRVQLFNELMDGSRAWSMEQLKRELRQVGLNGDFDGLAVGLVEIDYYAPFAEQYSPSDQSLFKFTLRSAVQEIAEAENEQLWTEWVAPNRLGLIYRLEGTGKERQQLLKLKQLAERARVWVGQYLKFTVTIGMSEPVKRGEELPAAFHQAAAAVERKISFGPNQVYVYEAHWAQTASNRGHDVLLQEMRETAQLYRLGNPDWELLLEQTCRTMAAGLYTREDLTGLIRIFKSEINREMQELPQESLGQWQASGWSRLSGMPEEFEWIGDARELLHPLLQDAQQQLQSLRMNRQQYMLASEVRNYIAGHYADQELSLSHLSEAFDMNTKTLSRIFKEEIGEKFVDYLARVRIEKAKQLLEETNEPVQSIAEKIGYLYPMSFIRVFKKLVGMTPGDYRKEMEHRK